MEHFNHSQYQYEGYQGNGSYQDSSYQVADTAISSNLIEDPGLQYAWCQPVISQVMNGYVNYTGQIQQYPLFHHDTAPNHHLQQSYDQQVYLASPGPPPQGPTYITTHSSNARHNYHSAVQPLSGYNTPDGYTNFAPGDVPQNGYVPFVQPGSAESGPSTIASSVSRQLATDAVSDAAEKRRVNPHRFFCQYCDRGFTAKHNYYRHLGAHNDERPFSCECGSAFTTKSDLKRHMFKSKKHGNGQFHSAECNEPC